MKFSYKFSNLLGTIYRNGNLVFTPDGNTIITPVGNRLTIYDLKNNKATTLSLESRYNYTNIALAPDGSLLIAVNETGEAQMISMISCTVIHRHKFRNKIQFVVFSPDGQHFAVAQENHVFIFKSPGELTGEYNPFVLERHFLGGYDDITWLDWSSDSRFLAIGCRDNTTKVIALRFTSNFRTYILGGHSEPIVACFFEHNSLHLNTLSRNGQLCIWECSLPLSELEVISRSEIAAIVNKSVKKRKSSKAADSEDSEDDIENNDKHQQEGTTAGTEQLTVDENEIKDEDAKKSHPFLYKKLSRHYLADEPRKEHRDAYLTAANYNKRTKILVVAFSTGAFYLYEIPDVNMIHSLSISDYPISSAVFNNTGDWVALASKSLGQLLVWEWQSEQYIMKQQGHISEMTCASYSPDGQFIATGGDDAKVKLWNTQSGFCFVTFSEHTSGITDIQFSRNKRFLVSSSLDGTVRAFDITRYRNFRTFTSPRSVQFSCVALDYSGEFVVAGGQDVFEIYLWSIKLGKLLEIISAHEGPVCALAFSPLPTSSTLISGSWDKTIKIWNCIETSSAHETIDLLSDVTCLAYNPNGKEVAVGTLNGYITMFEVETAVQVGCIEGRNDLGSGRSDNDLITAKKNLEGKCFTSIEYSADGECILAGGKSQMICIYNVRESILLKKFEITQNHSLDGLDEYISRRNLSEFGNLALIEQREENEGGNVAIRLPGMSKVDAGERNYKPEIQVFDVKFSPTGQSFATACTEGLLIYSLDKGIVFDPFDLSLEVTPKAIKYNLKCGEFLKALIMSLKLNEVNIITLVLEQIPYSDIELICSTITGQYAQRLLQHVARMLQTTRHIEFYLRWSCCLLDSHGIKDGVFDHHSLLSLHDVMSRKYEALSKICDFNKYTMRALVKIDKRNKDEAEGKYNDATDADTVADEDLNEEDLMLMKVPDDDEVLKKIVTPRKIDESSDDD